VAGNTVRGTRGSTILVISGLLHDRGKQKARACPHCGAQWSMAYSSGEAPRIWKNGEETPHAVLDWVGNNAAVECCIWPTAG
jgi:hypothetical protein